MYTLSKRSLDNRATCHIDIIKICDEVIKVFDYSVICGYRNEEDQNKAYSEGKTQVQWPNGKHNKNPSMAFDAYPYPIDLHPTNQREKDLYIQRMCYFAGQVMAIARRLKEDGKITHSLRWGADWDSDTELKDHSFLDYPHFELF